MLPFLPGVVPFGLLAGVAASEAGLGLVGAVAFSVGVFGGASQLAALDLLGRDASAAVAILTVAAINLRFLMYGASIAPWWAPSPRRHRLAAAYLLTDHSYLLSISRYDADPTPRRRLPFYLGIGTTMWLVWNASTAVGAVVGDVLPDDVPLAFAVPLMFLALLVPAVTSRPTAVAALVAGVTAVATAGLPANLGLLLGIVLGVLAGTSTAVRVEGVSPRR